MTHRCLICILPLLVTSAWSGERPAGWKLANDTFNIDTIRPQTCWVTTEAMPPDRWQPVLEPNLEAELQAVASLNLTDVAPPPERCWVGHRPYLVPNPDGESWDMVYPYYNKYGGVQEVVIHDFGSGQTQKQVLSTREGTSILTRERIDFHMQPSFFTAGKLVFEMYGPVMFVVYDPAANAFSHGVKPFGDEVINGRCVLGDDGIIYGMGWPKDKSGLIAYRFDPASGKAERFETFGPPNEHRRELYRHVVMSGQWLYAALGSQPWHLVAFNFETAEGRLLATTRDIIGDSQTIALSQVAGGLSGHIRQAASLHKIDTFDRNAFPFWLHDGKIYPRKGDIPPWSNRPVEQRARNEFQWAREFQVWPRGFKPPSPPPWIKKDASSPNTHGQVTLSYQMGATEPRQTLQYDVQMYPGMVRMLTEINDHVLFATDEGYGQHVFYDLASKRLRRIGGTISPYSVGLFQGRLYVSGYPGSQLIEYDLGRPFGLDQRSPNPKRLGFPASDTHTPLAGTIGAADGRVYNAGTTLGRRRTGGGMGWYDTKTGRLGGLPLNAHRIFWMTSAADGRYIVLSSKCEETGKLFVWDTQTDTFIHQTTPPGTTRPGPIVEAIPGLIMGHAATADGKGMLFGFDPAAGKTVWTKPVPNPPVTAFSLVRRHAYSFRRGPDGMIWTFFDKTLVRIDPITAQVNPVGKTEPAQLAFAMGHVYIAGGSTLRRIEGIATASEP